MKGRESTWIENMLKNGSANCEGVFPGDLFDAVLGLKDGFPAGITGVLIGEATNGTAAHS